MTNTEIAAMVNKIRTEGYAIVVWSPDELNGLDPSYFEDICSSYGNDFIDMNAPEIETK